MLLDKSPLILYISPMPSSLNQSQWVNSFTTALTADPLDEPKPREVLAHYSLVKPTPVPNPKLLLWNPTLAEQMGVVLPNSPEELNFYAGNAVPKQAAPFAQCYGGHQFGHWANQLGDGRAITLGEICHMKQNWEIQLKGSGITPYSRNGDGKAVLRSSLREFFASEYNHALGVATTRALTLISTGESVIRDLFYDGNPAEEPGAIVTRVASSFIRFGNFEIFSARNDRENLQKLFTYVLENFYPELLEQANPADSFYEILCTKTANLISQWMKFGFVHGVMNTDNMSILGLTIDYGPYAWLENFSLSFTPNTTDLPGRRYCYGRQPYIAQWNLEKLAVALKDIGLSKMGFQKSIETYQQQFVEQNKNDFSTKLGLSKLFGEDEQLKTSLFYLLERLELDFTLFFRQLSKYLREEIDIRDFINDVSYKDLSTSDLASLQDWLDQYKNRLLKEETAFSQISIEMEKTNPAIIYRNYMTHILCEDLIKDQLYKAEELFLILQNPFDKKWEKSDWFNKRPIWANETPGCTMLSCSS